MPIDDVYTTSDVPQRHAPAAPGPRSLLLPSAADVIFIVLLLALTCSGLASRLFDDGGIGWHIRTGQIILQTHRLPRADPFSVRTAGKVWFAWEWLFDLAVAGVHAWRGLNGIALLAALVIATTFALALRTALRNGASLLITVLLSALALAASSIHFFARPHIVTWLMAVIWFRILDRSEEQGNSRTVLFLPFSMVLWVNLHGGFLLGFMLLGIYLVSAAAEYFLRTGTQIDAASAVTRMKMLGAVMGLSLIASFINPYGYSLYGHIYGYLSDRFLMSHIDEFQSPNFHGTPQRCFAVLVLIGIAALAAGRRKLKLSHLLIVFFSVFSGLYASRNLPVSSLLLVMVIAPTLSRKVGDLHTKETILPQIRTLIRRYCSFSVRMSEIELRNRWGVWSFCSSLTLGILVATGGHVSGHQLIDAHFREQRFPVQAVNVIEQRDIRDPLFAPDYWGGYLIYRLYPENKVFIDDRHDLYGDQAIKDYMQVVFVQPQWQTVLNKEGVDWVLAPAESSLANILRVSPAWTLQYQDRTAAIFKRNTRAQR